MGMDHTMWSDPIELWNFLPANCERLDSEYVQSRYATPSIGIMTRLCRVLNEFKDDVNEGGGGDDDNDESDLEYIVLWNYNLLLIY